jgi:hypothetical protein
MATVNGLTAERTIEIEDAIIVTGTIDGSGHLIFTRNDATTFDAGQAKGATGTAGVSGAIAVDDLEDVPPGTPAGTPVFLRD